MTYITGTISDANADTLLYGEVATALSAAGYTLVDTVVISTRTHKVWKSPAGANTAGLDWYLDIAYATTGASGISFHVFENFDPATDLAYRGPVDGNYVVGNIETVYYSRHGNTGYPLESTSWMPRPGGNTDIKLATSSSAFGYWISITADRVIGMTSPSPTLMVYSGLYTPSSQQVENSPGLVFPLVTTTLTATGNTSNLGVLGMTRIPKVTGNVSYQMMMLRGSSMSQALPTPPIPSGNLAVSGTKDLLQIPLVSTISPLGVWGYLKDIRVTRAANTVVRGDTVLIGADTWVLSSTGGSGDDTSAIALKAV